MGVPKNQYFKIACVKVFLFVGLGGIESNSDHDKS